MHVYPLKGARGIDLRESRVLFGGLERDRRFMLVSEDGVFVSQRGHPRLALIDVALEPDAMVIAGRVRVPLGPEGPRRRVRVWRDDVEAVEIPGEAAELLSDHLGARVSLVFMPDDVLRQVDLDYARAGDRVGFADAFPVLVASQASLADVQARIPPHASTRSEDRALAVAMRRFRPNLVLSGGGAFDEERFDRLRVGEVTLRLAKRCARCEVTTIDPDTAERGKEPLATLASYRKDGQKILFAMNAIPDVEGVVRAGDRIAYLEPLGPLAPGVT